MNARHKRQDTRGKTEIILALDVDSFSGAKHFVNLLYPKIRTFKVGLQLFTGCGPRIIEFIHKKGAGVFLDLKFLDIPNTVAQAVRQAVRLKVKMLTLHIAGGKEMLIAAKEAARGEALRLKLKAPRLIGVTVLTSKTNNRGLLNSVLRLSHLAKDAGLDGVVCSTLEAKFVRREFGREFIIVTPGIRLSTDNKADQKRTASAQEAINAGSNYLVIGRPILRAQDPALRVKEILGELV